MYLIPWLKIRLEQHRRRGRAVADLLALFPQHLTQEHRPHLGIAIRQPQNAAGNQPAVIQQLGWHVKARNGVNRDEKRQRH